MLMIVGDVLDVTSETVNGQNGSFVSTTIHILDGVRVEQVRVGRDFPGELPKKGEKCTLNVVVSTWAGRNGSGYRLTALSRVQGARVAAAS